MTLRDDLHALKERSAKLTEAKYLETFHTIISEDTGEISKFAKVEYL